MENSQKIGLPPKLIGMLKTIYDSIECRVRINGKDSEPFQILVGLLQGDSNSTILFNIVFAVIFQITNQRLENIGIKRLLQINKNVFKVLQSKAKGEIINIYLTLFLLMIPAYVRILIMKRISNLQYCRLNL